MIRPSTLVLVLLVSSAAAGCVANLGGKSAATIIQERLTTLPSGGGDPNDRYLAMKGKKKNKDGFQIYGVPRELWAPFRLEWSGGVMDAKKPDLGNSFFYMQLTERQPAPAAFWALCGAKGSTANSLTAFATSSMGNFGTPHEFENAKVLEFAFDHDGTDLHLLARAEGDASFIEIGLVPNAQLDEMVALIPNIGATALRKKNVVGFDNIRVVSNGAATLKQLDTQIAARHIYEAADIVTESLYRLDGTDPETAQVTTDITNAKAAIDVVRTDLTSIAGQPALDASAKLNVAKSKLDKAQKAINKGKSAEKIGDKIGAAIDEMFQAAVGLDPAE